MKIIKREAQRPKSTIYGRKLSTRTRLGADSYMEATEEFSDRKIISIELLRMNLPHPVDVIETTFIKNGIVEREYKELETLRSDEELERGKRIFKTLEKILNKREVRSIKASSFAEEMIERLTADVRFAYKQFYTENYKNTAHSVYIYTVLAIVIATVSATSDINFESPIDVSITKEGKAVVLSFKMNIIHAQNLRRREKLVKIPKLESKLAYLSALCREDNVKGTVKSVGSSVIFEYKIKEASPEAPCLYAKEDEEALIFNELLNAFNPPLSVDVELEGEMDV